MATAIIGRACTYDVTVPHELNVHDPSGGRILTVAFVNGESARRFAEAVKVLADNITIHEGIFDFAASEGADQW